MPLDKIKDKLKDTIGLDISSIGTSALVSAVNRRMRDINKGAQAESTDSYEDYLCYLLANELEIKPLIEEIVVPETWFFRDDKPFPVLAGHVKKLIMSGSHNSPINILSMPSATGEEPYSIAITLLECGLAEDQFTLDAIDVSSRALDIARAGIYGKNSFRGKQDSRIIEKYFSKSGNEYIISDQVRNSVNFNQMNVLKIDVDLSQNKYDVIFCRNMLIYFDLHNKMKTYDIIGKILKDEGLLFVGHAETSSVPSRIFTSSKHESSFSFIKDPNLLSERVKLLRGAPEISVLPTVTRVREKQNKILLTKINPHASHNKSAVTIVNNPINNNNKHGSNIIPGEILESARKLADTGKLNEAKEICIKYLENNKNDAQGYFLLGLIAIASDEMSVAEQYLRKSIYLDPERHEALAHLSLILEQSGDMTGADRMRKRARKAEIAGKN